MLSEGDRNLVAEKASEHLPKPPAMISVSDQDDVAMKAAFRRRFNEDVPRTETLYSVAAIGYRMALRDHAATEVARLREALITVKVNLMRDGPTEALYDYISKQLQPQ